MYIQIKKYVVSNTLNKACLLIMAIFFKHHLLIPTSVSTISISTIGNSIIYTTKCAKGLIL